MQLAVNFCWSQIMFCVASLCVTVLLFFREKREQELEYFLKKKYNKLGTKLQAKVEHVNTLKTNENLVLK